jgi:hypothetical protein
LDKNENLNETFLKLFELNDKSAKGIYNIVSTFLKKENLFDKLVAYASDGEHTVYSDNKGVPGILLNELPHMLINYCVAHNVNLTGKEFFRSSSKLELLNKFIYNLCTFFQKSNKRQFILYENEDDYELQKYLKLLKPFDIRWLSLKASIERIIKLDGPICKSLEEIYNSNKISNQLALELCTELRKFEILSQMVIILDILEPISKYLKFLQNRNINMLGVNIKYDLCQLEYLDMYKNKIGDHLKRFHDCVSIDQDLVYYDNIQLILPENFAEEFLK